MLFLLNSCICWPNKLFLKIPNNTTFGRELLYVVPKYLWGCQIRTTRTLSLWRPSRRLQGPVILFTAYMNANTKTEENKHWYILKKTSADIFWRTQALIYSEENKRWYIPKKTSADIFRRKQAPIYSEENKCRYILKKTSADIFWWKQALIYSDENKHWYILKKTSTNNYVLKKTSSSLGFNSVYLLSELEFNHAQMSSWQYLWHAQKILFCLKKNKHKGLKSNTTMVVFSNLLFSKRLQNDNGLAAWILWYRPPRLSNFRPLVMRIVSEIKDFFSKGEGGRGRGRAAAGRDML